MTTTLDLPLLECGDIAMSQHAQDHDGLGPNHPSCVVHFDAPGGVACRVVEKPSLEGRMAICGYKHKRDGSGHEPVPSSYDLPFFTYKGPGSPAAAECCKHCPYTQNAHRFGPFYNPGRCPNCSGYSTLTFIGNNMFRCEQCNEQHHAAKLRAKHNPDYTPHEFEPHGPFEYDTYYCGCWGWD